MKREVQEIVERRDALVKLHDVIGNSIREAQNQSIQVLPRFEEYGWGRLEVFSNRLRDAVDNPLVEQARQVLEKAGLLLDHQTIKEAVQEKHEDVLEVVNAIAGNLAEVKGDEIYQRIAADLEASLKRGEWDKAVERSKDWKDFYVDYLEIRKGKNGAIRALALKEMLEEGPGSEVPARLATAKEQAIALGGTRLWSVISKKTHNTLENARASLEKISVLKSQLEQIRGESFDLNVLLKRGATLAALSQRLQEESQLARTQLGQELTQVDMLLRRVNNLSLLAEEDQEADRQIHSVKEARERATYLNKRLVQLCTKVSQSLSEDAIGLADGLTQKELPEDWTDAKIVAALKELLAKCAFRLEV